MTEQQPIDISTAKAKKRRVGKREPNFVDSSTHFWPLGKGPGPNKPDFYEGTCPNCDDYHFSLPTIHFPMANERKFSPGSEVPIPMPPIGWFVGECPHCFEEIFAVFNTVPFDENERHKWDEAREANLHDSHFLQTHPQPRSHHFLVKYVKGRSGNV